MSDIITAVNTYLRTKSGVTTLVANDANGSDHIHPDKLPQSVSYPAIQLSVVYSDSIEDVTGSEGTAQSRVQVDCIGRTHLTAEALREAVRQAMQGYRGSMGSVSVGEVSVTNRIDLYDPPDDGSDSGYYQRTIEFLITHAEAIPA